MTSTLRFLNGVHPITGEGLSSPGPLDPALRHRVPEGRTAQALDVRAGSSTDELHAAAPRGATGELVVDLVLVA